MDTQNKLQLNIADTQLMMMSLSGVTERCGLEGLYKRFSLEIDSYSLEEQYFCNQALYVASFLHRKDRPYKGLPYASHLLRTSLRLMRDYDICDSEMIAGMLLHDSVEDHPEEIVKYSGKMLAVSATATRQAVDVLCESFSPRTGQLVDNLTNAPAPTHLDMPQKNALYLDGVAKKIALSTATFLMKLSDFTDNAVGILWGEDTKRLHKLATKYLPVFDVFLAQLAVYEQSGELTTKQVTLARQQLQLGSGRCAALSA